MRTFQGLRMVVSDSETGLEVWCDDPVKRIAVNHPEIRVTYAIAELLVGGLKGSGYSVLYLGGGEGLEIEISEGMWTFSLERLDRLGKLRRRLAR